MFQIDSQYASSTMPTPLAVSNPGWFAAGDPALGVQYTAITRDFLNIIQAELLNVLSPAGLTPSKTVFNQIITAIQSCKTNFAVDSGSTNTVEIQLNPPIVSYTEIVGMPVYVKIAANSLGASTININGVGARGIVDKTGAAISTGLYGGQIAMFIFNGSYFNLM